MISTNDEKTLKNLLSLASEPEEALTYDALLGFLFGVAITPEVVMPSEWLPRVFGEKMITADTEQEVNRCFEALGRVINGFIARFNEDALQFPFDLENLTEETNLDAIQDWTYGLDEALNLRPDYWYELLPDFIGKDEEEEYDEELLTSLAVVHGIAWPEEAGELFTTEYEDDEDRSERLLATLFAMLPEAVDVLLNHAAALEQERQDALRQRHEYPPQSPQVGRNDPCPCGSGKKYKKCCMGKAKIVPIR